MLLKAWKRQLGESSGNLTTNAAMPVSIANKLLEDNPQLKEEVALEEIFFPKFRENKLDALEGLHILAGLQSKNKKDCLTLFRAVRFPTYKRMHALLTYGFTISNYEQERILELYKNADYTKKRTANQADERFWVQPQERVVDGVPVFALANDAIQIHRAFRGKEDKLALVVLHVPREHLEAGKIRLIANTAIDFDYKNADRDIPIRDFMEKDGFFQIDYAALRARGVDLHEMYSQDLPLTKVDAEALGIEQEFFLIDLYEVEGMEAMNVLEADTQILKENKWFLHGLFGDQNIFGRRKTKHLPYRCYSLKGIEVTSH